MLSSRVWDNRKQRQVVMVMTFFLLETMTSSTCLPPKSTLNIFMKLTWNTWTQMFSLNGSLKAEDLFSFFFFKVLVPQKLKDSVTTQDYVKQWHRWYFPYKSIYTILSKNHEKKLKYPSNF